MRRDEMVIGVDQFDSIFAWKMVPGNRRTNNNRRENLHETTTRKKPDESERRANNREKRSEILTPRLGCF